MGNSQSKVQKGEKKGKQVSFEIADERENIHAFTVDEKLLTSHSSVFKHLSKSGVLKKNKVVRLNNITFPGLQRILQFLETNEVSFEDHKEAQETLKAALEYRIENAKDACLEYLLTELNQQNVCEIYEFSEAHDLSELSHACLQIIDRYTHAIIDSSGFMKLKLHTLLSISKRSNLNLRSEFSLMQAIVAWGKHEMARRGVDFGQTQVFIDIIAPALDNLRCKAMSNRKHCDHLMVEVLKHILARGLQSSSEQSLQRSFARHYCEYYSHKLAILECPQMALSAGDRFNLRLEVLKGRVFFYGVSLALRVASSVSASSACLYSVLSATNINTTDKKVVRETFFDVNTDARLKLRSPLTVKENESFSLELTIQLTGKVSPLSRKNEVEIFFSPTQDVAMKIFSDQSTQKAVKCIFKELLYYF